MSLLDIIFFILCGVWLIGFTWDFIATIKAKKIKKANEALERLIRQQNDVLTVILNRERKLKEQMKEESMDELIKRIEIWSIDRGLNNQDSGKQILKLVEEFGELVQGHLKNNVDQIKDSIGDMMVVMIIFCQQENIRIKDALNRTSVGLFNERHLKDVDSCLKFTLRHISQLADRPRFWPELDLAAITDSIANIGGAYDLTVEECLRVAYEEIKDRKGKMVNGVFVKEEDIK